MDVYNLSTDYIFPWQGRPTYEIGSCELHRSRSIGNRAQRALSDCSRELLGECQSSACQVNVIKHRATLDSVSRRLSNECRVSLDGFGTLLEFLFLIANSYETDGSAMEWDSRTETPERKTSTNRGTGMDESCWTGSDQPTRA